LKISQSYESHFTKTEYVSIWNRFTEATETGKKISTTGCEVVLHIDYPTAKKVRITELEHRCLFMYMDAYANVIEP